MTSGRPSTTAKGAVRLVSRSAVGSRIVVFWA